MLRKKRMRKLRRNVTSYSMRKRVDVRTSMSADTLTPAVYIEESPTRSRLIEGVPTAVAAFVGVTQSSGDDDCYKDKAIPITSWGDFVGKFGRYSDAAPHMAPAVQGFFSNGGTYCYVVSVENEEGIILAGLHALRNVEDVSIVAAPGITTQGVQQTLIVHCELLRNRVCILDSAEDSEIAQVQAQRAALGSARGYATLYYPWIKMGVEKKCADGNIVMEEVFVPPSGAVAGVYARTDMERGVHKAPANEPLYSATALQHNVNSAEQETLNPLGINCIRYFSGRGILVWGARTLSSDPEWKYVNVRRLLIYLEASIEKGTQWAVFEPNDAPLWARAVQSINDFLFEQWRNGALMGSRPDDAFFVKCGRDTMTQNEIDNAKMVIFIGVAPLKPAEFMTFTITHQLGS